MVSVLVLLRIGGALGAWGKGGKQRGGGASLVLFWRVCWCSNDLGFSFLFGGVLGVGFRLCGLKKYYGEIVLDWLMSVDKSEKCWRELQKEEVDFSITDWYTIIESCSSGNK